MIAWWERFSKRPLVAHLLRAIERFNTRGGSQLAAAIAYFSILSLVPILMLGFSLLGLTVTVFMPDALASIVTAVNEALPGNDEVSRQIVKVIEDALRNWLATLLTGSLIGFWFGSNWIGNLKRAARLLMRSDVDNPGKLLPLPLDLLANFAGLVGLFVGVVVTFAASSAASTLTEQVGRLLGIDHGSGWSVLLRVVGLLISFAAGTGLFWLLFSWFAPEPIPGGLLWVGSAVGSAGLLVLQLAAGLLAQAFSNNLAAGVFGVTIIVMLFLNLFATLILFIAAWLATQSEPVAEPEPVPEPEVEPVETRPGQLVVSARVAEQSLSAGLKAGYVIGTATGLGLGAVLVGGLRALFGRRSR